uniref:MYND-type domain-containing protein n=1 Tax=Chromera velia CCMP2878 TaxID=1169474 RepID=A0A0G4I1Z1_9ALVE|eukprot:Cvel_10233.t1-p1 / transcript=Cvel_10233.t1 / gene=Cvel_10233 / organism=Chromera_velia_CCMP2878 / gene_product=hypothetical protein / transcript_product=hypothetical protein / location=Cvel_scaffold613:4040-5263(+) / protein_length=408 / sequence_SO=supercontig / SO=protein_coding / is_pseudo=false
MIYKLSMTQKTVADKSHCTAVLLLRRLMSLPVPDETVIEFNKVSPDEQPLDVSRLIRAAVWFISPESVAVRLREDPINSSNSAWASPNAFLHRWALSVRFFLRLAISLKRSFLEATQKAFADSEANNDALKLFEMATSGFENDHHGIGLPSEEKREEYLMNRLLALQCVLSNPAVIKFIDKKQVKILSKMRKVHSALYTTLPAGSHKPFTLLNLFLAWLEAITLRSKANMRDCTELLNLKDQCPEIAAGLGKVRAQDLCSVFHSLGTKKESKTRDTQVEEKESDTDTLIQRTKKEMRKEAPLPCFVCGKCVPTFMYCAVCQMLVYCGRECQKRDWKRKPGGHKERCALLKENVTDVLLKEAQPQPQNPADGLCVSAYVHLLKDKVVETLLQGAQMGRGEEEATASELN